MFPCRTASKLFSGVVPQISVVRWHTVLFHSEWGKSTVLHYSIEFTVFDKSTRGDQSTRVDYTLKYHNLCKSPQNTRVSNQKYSNSINKLFYIK